MTICAACLIRLFLMVRKLRKFRRGMGIMMQIPMKEVIECTDEHTENGIPR